LVAGRCRIVYNQVHYMVCQIFSDKLIDFVSFRFHHFETRSSEKEFDMLYKFDGRQPTVGKDSYVSELATVIGDVVIGDNCYIGHGAILRGDYGRIEVGDGTAVEEGAVVHCPPGDVNRMGKRVTIGHGAVIHGRNIGDSAVIGMGAIVSIWADIGEWAIVAEGGIIKLNQVIPARVVVAGNPAQIVRDVTEKDQEVWNMGKQVYIDLAKKYLDVGMEPIEG